MIENGFAQLLRIPSDHGVVLIAVAATGKHFVAVARGVEEINRLPLREAVAGGADVERSVGHRNQVGRHQHILPGVEVKRSMVKLAFFGMLDKSHIVRFHRHAQKLGNALAIGREHLLGQIKAQHFVKQFKRAVEIIAIKQAVIETGGLHTFQIARPSFGVVAADAVAVVLLFVGIKLKHMPRGRGEAHAPAAAGQLTRFDFGHIQAAESFQLLLQLTERGVVHHLECHKIHARAVGFAQHHRKFVHFGPAFEIHAALFILAGLNQAEQVAVVGDGLFHIQHTDLHVARTHYTFSHLATPLVLFLWGCRPAQTNRAAPALRAIFPYRSGETPGRPAPRPAGDLLH